MNGVVEVEFLHECREIGGIRIHVIAGPRLARSAVTATIVRNTAVPAIRKEHHLVFPGVAIQWRAVAEDNRLTGPPIFEEEFGAVSDGDGVTCSRDGRPDVHRIPPFEAGWQIWVSGP